MEANVKHIIDQIIEICVLYGDVDEVILYGSRAKGTHLPKSGIDIAINLRG